jgi:hypothetical protein
MTERDIRKKIARLIIEIEKPFSIAGLLYVCRMAGIPEEDLVLDVLEELCDNGVVKYSEIRENCWAFARSA